MDLKYNMDFIDKRLLIKGKKTFINTFKSAKMSHISKKKSE